MISLEEIEKAILDLESHDTSYAACEKLAWLYVVRDHMNTANKTRAAAVNGSEFLDACDGHSAESVLMVINEHMSCVKALYPKEYAAIISKIKGIE